MRVEIQWGPDLDPFPDGWHPGGVFASANFLSVVASEIGGTPGWLRITEREGSHVSFAIPVVVKQGPLGEVWNSIGYFGSPGGIYSSEEVERETASRILAEIRAFLDNRGDVASFTLMTGVDAPRWFSSIEEVLGRSWIVTRRRAQVTDLSAFADSEEFFAALPSARRRNIRKAQREGVHVRFSESEEDMDFLARVHHDNITEIGGLPKRREFFDGIRSKCEPEFWKLAVAEVSDERVAALLMLKNGPIIEYFTPAVVKSWRASQAMVHVDFVAMSWALSAGYLTWNWGGTHENQESLHRFKAQWLAVDTPYNYLTLVVNRDLREEDVRIFSDSYRYLFVYPFGRA